MKEIYRCGWCGLPTNKEGEPLLVVEVKLLDFDTLITDPKELSRQFEQYLRMLVERNIVTDSRFVSKMKKLLKFELLQTEDGVASYRVVCGKTIQLEVFETIMHFISTVHDPASRSEIVVNIDDEYDLEQWFVGSGQIERNGVIFDMHPLLDVDDKEDSNYA
jgi:hypothetical protein